MVPPCLQSFSWAKLTCVLCCSCYAVLRIVFNYKYLQDWVRWSQHCDSTEGWLYQYCFAETRTPGYSIYNNVFFLRSRCRQVAKRGGCYCWLQHGRSSNPLGLLPEHLWWWRYWYYAALVTTWLTRPCHNSAKALLNESERKYQQLF